MTDDLRRALDDLAGRTATAHSARGGLPVAAMTARAHRRRVRRTAIVSGAVAASLVVVAVAGYAVTSWDGSAPLPADSPTAAPTPTPTPTLAAVLPAADPAAEFGVCGSVVGATTDPSADPSASIELDAPASALGGAEIEVSTRLVPPAGATRGFERSSGPRVVLTHEGVVVATIDPYPEQSQEQATFVTASSVSFDNTVTNFVSHRVPQVCDAGNGTGQPGAALPAGDYEVYAIGELWWSSVDPEATDWPSGSTVQQQAASGEWTHVTALGGPVTLRVETEQIDPATVSTPPTGTPAPVDEQGSYGCDIALDTSSGDFTATGPTDTVEIAAGEEIPFSLTVAYTGPGRATWIAMDPAVLVVRDGEPVAVMDGVDYRPIDGDAGTTRTTVGSAGPQLSACDGQSWWFTNPGTYTVYPVEQIQVLDLSDSSGARTYTRDPQDFASHTLVGAPFTLVVG